MFAVEEECCCRVSLRPLAFVENCLNFDPSFSGVDQGFGYGLGREAVGLCQN